MNIPQYKSKVISLFDFKDIDLSQIIPKFEINSQQLKHDIMRLRKKNAVMTDGDCVFENDFVIISCQSENKRFNKSSITVKVGKGLFSKELEKCVIGMKIGETKTVNIKGDNVTVCVEKISRQVIPELTDEAVKSWGIDGVSGAEALKAYFINQQRNAYIADTAEGMAGEIQRIANEKSVFELDEEEIAQVKSDGYALLSEMFKNSGIDIDNSSDEEVKEQTGMTLSEHTAYISAVFVDSFKSSLVACELIKQSSTVFTDEDYKKALKEQAEFNGATESEAEESFTFDIFIKQRISDWYFETVEEHIKNYLSEE